MEYSRILLLIGEISFSLGKLTNLFSYRTAVSCCCLGIADRVASQAIPAYMPDTSIRKILHRQAGKDHLY